MPFGSSVHIDVVDCTDISKENCDILIQEILDKTGMKIYNNHLYNEYYRGRDQFTEGETFIGMLETSSMSLHTVPRTGRIYLDFFSCKNLDVPTIASCCSRIVGGKITTAKKIHRE